MRTIPITLLLLASAGIAGCGGGATPPLPSQPLALTKEQAEAIASEDSKVQEEEGGAFIAKQAKAKKK